MLTAVPGGGYKQEYLTAGGGRLKWRLSQFRSPELGYRLRARSDTEDPPPENIPQVSIYTLLQTCVDSMHMPSSNWCIDGVCDCNRLLVGLLRGLRLQLASRG